jgi:hypothetical protein
MRLVQRFVQAGRIGRTRSFVVALVVAAMVLPPATALAYFSSTGSGTFANVQAVATSPSTVSIVQTPAIAYVYKDSTGATVTSLMLGGQVLISMDVTCLTGAPCQVNALVLQSWTSDKAGCDSTTLPTSFSIGSPSAFSIATVGAKFTSNVALNWLNLATNQTACLGAKFSFVVAAG